MVSNKMDFKKLFKDGKLRNIIIICCVLGMVLILLSSLFPTDNKETNNTYSVVEYKNDMENSLKSILTKIQGVGETEVLLTMESSVEGVYLENNTTKTKDIEPVIRGVVVVCEGGDQPLVTARVLNAVTKALNISSAKVCVTKLNE